MIKLVTISFDFEEINHSAYFLLEMEKYNYQIPKDILDKFMNLNISKQILLQQNKHNL